MNRPERTFATRQIRLERRLPSYWRVTFDIPPVNIFGPKELPQLNEIITAIENDEQVKVVVFDSAVDGFFLTHYDFLAPLEESAKIPPGPTGLQALAGHAGAPQPGSGGVHRLDPGTRDRSRKRACAGERHALREPREGHSVAMGSRRGPRAGRRTDGPAATSDGQGAGAGSIARRRRYPWRPRRTLRLRQSLASGLRARWLRRCARDADRVVRQAGDRGDQASCRRREPAARCWKSSRNGTRSWPLSDVRPARSGSRL